MPVYARYPQIAKPDPPWLQAERARRADAPAYIRRPPEQELVSHHVPPWREAAIDEAPSPAQTFARAAAKAGLEVAVRMAGERAVQIGVARAAPGERPVLWMRATWSRTLTGPWSSKGVRVTDEAGTRQLGTTAAKALW